MPQRIAAKFIFPIIQIANNQLRAQAQEEREKTMAEMANAENDKVNEVHVRKTNEQKKSNHVEVNQKYKYIINIGWEYILILIIFSVRFDT